MAIEWFLAKYQKRLLEVFFDTPNVSYNIHELAKKANLDPGNATRYVQECVLLGLLKKEKKKNEFLISPNYAQPHIRKIYELFEVDRTWRFIKANEKLAEPIRFLKDILSGLDSLLLLSLWGFDRDPASLMNNNLSLLIIKKPFQSSLLVKETVGTIWAEYGLEFKIRAEILDDEVFCREIKKSSEFLKDFWQDRIVLSGEDYLWKTLPELEIKLGFRTDKAKVSNYILSEQREAAS